MLTRYKNILVAIDGSKNSYLAFEQALEIALEQQEVALYILEVVDNQSQFIGPSTILSDQHSYSLDSIQLFQTVVKSEVVRVEESVNKLAEEARRRGISTVVSIVTTGNHKVEIAENIPKEKSINLIVMGATGRGKIKSAILGTTAGMLFNMQHVMF